MSVRCFLTAFLLPALATPALAQDVQATRTSQYIAVRDGTRLAIDIYRPSVNGRAIEKPLPVIVAATLGVRAEARDGKDGPVSLSGYLMHALKQGYVIVTLETRGQGASFGQSTLLRIERPTDYWDMYDAIEWMAAQPWSNGNIGMAGCSNQGVIQFRAAAAMPPHLKAIAPTSAPIDWVTMGSVNGVSTNLFAESGPYSHAAPPVDEDSDGALLAAAMMEHGADTGVVGGKARITRPFRDAPVAPPGHPVSPAYWWNFMPTFAVSKIPVFQYAGWRDFFAEQSFELYRSLAREGVHQKFVIGPWYHCEWYQSSLTDAGAETVRWYDYWLKGVDNGVTSDPPIRYYVVNAPAGKEWKTADRWPLPNERPQAYFLGEGGKLSPQQPKMSASSDQYVVNYSATTSRMATRWNLKALSGGTKDPSLLPISTADVDASSLTYTSAPLGRDAELTGFPVVSLWISSTAKDQDFFVYLEEVDPEGRSTLLTEGAMRASNRATREPPFDNQGMPWHPSYKADQKSLEPGVPTKLQFALFPFSNYIKKGHRLRVAINSFDKDNWDTPQVSPAPTVHIYHDSNHPSSVSLPFIR